MRCCVGGFFALRQAHRLNYCSQSADGLGRLHGARDKALARATGKDGNPRPRGANRERLVERWIALDEAADNMFASEALRLFGARFAAHGMDFESEMKGQR